MSEDIKSATQDYALSEREDALAIITLNRPDRLDALSGPVMDLLYRQLSAAAMVRTSMTADHKEAARAVMDKRRPAFTGR